MLWVIGIPTMVDNMNYEFAYAELTKLYSMSENCKYNII